MLGITLFFMFRKQYAKPKFMPIDYSRQIGKKMITKGWISKLPSTNLINSARNFIKTLL